MSEHTRTALPEPQANDALLGFVTFLVFAIAGPPLGLATLLLGRALLTGSMRFPMVPDWNTLQTFGLFSLVAYLLGGFQALLVGMVAALAQYRHDSRRISPLPVLLASVVTGAACVGIIAGPAQRFDMPNAAAMIGIHVGAALGCWLIASGLLCLLTRSHRAVH